MKYLKRGAAHEDGRRDLPEMINVEANFPEKRSTAVTKAINASETAE